MSFDTQDQNKEWKNLKSLNVAQYFHACQEGEFYVQDVDTCSILGDMKTNRYWHSFPIVNEKLVAAGGDNRLSSVEALNGTEWIVTNNLQSGRERHAAVSVPAGIITC